MNPYKYQITIIASLIFVIRNSACKTSKKYFSIVLLIQKLINSLMKMKGFFEDDEGYLELTYTINYSYIKD